MLNQTQVQELSSTLRRAFVKEADAPIQILKDPCFMYFVELFDSYCGDLKKKLENFINCVNACGNEERFNSYSYSLRNGIITRISSKLAYQNFITADMKQYASTGSKANLYQADNCGHRFISVDLVKANFAALRLFDPELVDGYETYEQFIANFTGYEHFRDSRQVRQYIFGNLNPKRQMTIAQFIIDKVSKGMKKEFPGSKIVASSHDEIVIMADDILKDDSIDKINGFNITVAMVEEIVEEALKNTNGAKARVKEFILSKVGNHNFYIKEFPNGDFQLKNVPEYFLPQVYKHIIGTPLTGCDMSFFFEGQMATFMEPLKLD